MSTIDTQQGTNARSRPGGAGNLLIFPFHRRQHWVDRMAATIADNAEHHDWIVNKCTEAVDDAVRSEMRLLGLPDHRARDELFLFLAAVDDAVARLKGNDGGRRPPAP